MWHVHVVGKMSKDIGMGVRKGTVVSFVPTLLFGDSIPHLLKCFFVTCFSCFFGGEGYRAIDPPLRKYV